MPVSFKHNQFALCTPTFCLPTPMGSQIQRKGARLVAELQRVGWDVADIDVNFRTYGTGKELIRVVDRISGATPKGPFHLSFNGKQPSLSPFGGRPDRRGGWNTNNQLDESIAPPGIVLKTWDDRSNTSVSNYTGRRWRSETVEAIRYAGDDKFENNNKFHAPDARELKKAEKAALALLDDLLGSLAPLPTAPGSDDLAIDGDANLRRLAHVERLPAPAGFPTLYARIKPHEASDRAANSGLGAAAAADRGYRAEEDYVLRGNGIRVVSLGASSEEGEFPERAFDGFEYATADLAENRGHPIHHSYEAVIPVEVKLDYLNDIFVIDTSVFDERRAAFFEAMQPEGRDRMTDRELNLCSVAVARTMVPASAYDGSYAEPTYLIGRQMDRDEARIMHGALRIEEGEGIRVVATDARTGGEFTVFEWASANKWGRGEAASKFDGISYLFRELADAERLMEPDEVPLQAP